MNSRAIGATFSFDGGRFGNICHRNIYRRFGVYWCIGVFGVCIVFVWTSHIYYPNLSSILGVTDTIIGTVQ